MSRRHAQDLARIIAGSEQLTDGGVTSIAPLRRLSGPTRLRLLGDRRRADLGDAGRDRIGRHRGLHVSAPDGAGRHAEDLWRADEPGTEFDCAELGPRRRSHPSATTSAVGSGVATGRLATTAWVDTHSTHLFAQQDLNFTAPGVATALRITVTVSTNSAVASTGVRTSIAAADLETTAGRVSGGLQYEIALKAGHSLPADLNRLGFQFNRPASGHDFALDTYSIDPTAADGATLRASGTFGG